MLCPLCLQLWCSWRFQSRPKLKGDGAFAVVPPWLWNIRSVRASINRGNPFTFLQSICIFFFIIYLLGFLIVSGVFLWLLLWLHAFLSCNITFIECENIKAKDLLENDHKYKFNNLTKKKKKVPARYGSPWAHIMSTHVCINTHFQTYIKYKL